jgi:hypothetical protein
MNQVLQWAGTACFMCMYVLMSFYPQTYPWNVIAGTAGGLLYLVWSLRVRNTPQIITNLVGVGVCVGGLFKYFG